MSGMTQNIKVSNIKNDFSIQNEDSSDNHQAHLQRDAILVVEDDRFSRTLISNIINQNFKNYTIFNASSFSEARASLITSDNIRLVILDIFLNSDQTGIDLLDTVESLKHHPKILISSVLEKGRVMQLTKNCPLDLSYIMKPAHPEKYIHAVETLLKEK